jgi:hypothetical protein
MLQAELTVAVNVTLVPTAIVALEVATTVAVAAGPAASITSARSPDCDPAKFASPL